MKYLFLLALSLFLAVTPVAIANAKKNTSESVNVDEACNPNANWKSHGEYVSCVAKLGLGGAVVSKAAESTVGQPTPSPSVLPSTEPSATPSATPVATPSVEPSATPSAEPSVSPSVEPSVEPSAEPSISPSPSPEEEATDSAEQAVNEDAGVLSFITEAFSDLVTSLSNIF